jgi:hypothetical protein
MEGCAIDQLPNGAILKEVSLPTSTTWPGKSCTNSCSWERCPTLDSIELSVAIACQANMAMDKMTMEEKLNRIPLMW